MCDDFCWVVIIGAVEGYASLRETLSQIVTPFWQLRKRRSAGACGQTLSETSFEVAPWIGAWKRRVLCC